MDLDGVGAGEFVFCFAHDEEEVAGECHFGGGNEEAAFGAVVGGLDEASFDEVGDSLGVARGLGEVGLGDA